MTRPRSVADWLRWQESLSARPVDLGLDRVRAVLGRLGLQPPAGRVVTVGGTNGKGSTITLVHDVLRAAGGNPGLYTSPHLVHYNERILIGGRPVEDAPLIRSFERVEAVRGGVPLTYFEFGTLAALASFAEAGCDSWLLEVGLGGRLDAVNALDADIAVITTIGLDHQEWLGDSIEAIAAEKAGILRPGSPALYGDSPVPAAIVARAAEIGAELCVMGSDFRFERDGKGGWAWHWPGSGGVTHIDRLLAPAHWTPAQFRNATVALGALARLRPPLELDAGFLNPVLLHSSPPGRLHVVRREHEWILDVAHNPQAAAVLREQLATLPLPAGGRGDVTVVLALLADKAIADFVRELRDVGARWIVAGVDDPRASPEALMREALQAAGITAFSWADTPAAAFERARQLTRPGGRIVVCGSFRIVAPALEWLGLY
ncbi:MAG: bifunctional folylpolyglutamate synthase/dihydrofolate synthase [Gammaproteobacteria bacterium]|nr:bifunctional folylpolyglutamate synthase/dihydrofolate synthase [Gammaproteobacteria bacterium]